MALRSFDIADFIDSLYQAELSESLSESMDMIADINQIVLWCDQHCTGKYIVMLKHVAFQNEIDALFFQLGFQLQ